MQALIRRISHVGVLVCTAVRIVMGFQCTEGKLITSLGVHLSSTDTLKTEDKISSVSRSNARYLRVSVSTTNAPSCDWVLTVRDDKYHVIQTIGREQLGKAPIWTRRIPGEVALLSLKACSDGSLPVVNIGSAIAMSETARNPYYSVHDPAHKAFYPLFEAPAESRMAGDNVGFLMAASDSPSADWVCSGVMLADG